MKQISQYWSSFDTPWLSYELFGNTIKTYLLAIIIYVLIRIGLKLFRTILIRKVKKITERTNNKFDDTLIKPLTEISGAFYSFIAFYAATKVLNTNDLINTIFNTLLLVIVIYEAIKIVLLIAEFLLQRTKRRQSSTTIQGLKLILKIILWSTGLLLILSNLGFDITALVASMGIGGIAVALAAQNILSDLFSSFMIYFDKPFEVGDYIVIGSNDGTVEKIGLKTTRLITPRGEELVVSNQELTSTRIQNFKKLRKRRVDFTIGVEYGTPNTKMKKIIPLIQKIVENTEGTEWFRGHFMEFADCSLNFKISYFVLSDQFPAYLEAHNAINFDIKAAFEKEKINMAFPTQTLHLVKN